MNWEDEAFYLTGAKNFEDFQKRVETYKRWQDPYIEEYKKEIDRLKERINKAIEYIKAFDGYDDDDVYGVIDILNGNKLGTYAELIEVEEEEQ